MSKNTSNKTPEENTAPEHASSERPVATHKLVWFPAKKNGWGWGKPCTWQGWLVMLIYLASIILFSVAIDPKVDLLPWSIAIGTSTLLLITMYVWKGDAPNWQWKTIDKKKRRLFK
ncbi:hypothetical protein [Marinomonas algarum]|uniref:Uncharacterized protein n=1 Tax=Marinomonas algarum TaxID=2883105 RepID=A0A9X1IML4_9GAMM|nr:hypothetical protein [Marinomonas algarum]MCB5160831.1 hypothetical protein [Marinomonas algarum]